MAMDPQDIAAWLLASHNEEKAGIAEYEKLLKHMKGVPEYSHIRATIKKIIRDEKRHLKMLGSLFSK